MKIKIAEVIFFLLITSFSFFACKESEELGISPESFENVNKLGDQVTVQIFSNTNWQVISDQSWVNPSVSDGSNDETITVTIDENTSIFSRSAILTVVTKSGELSKDVYFTQEENINDSETVGTWQGTFSGYDSKLGITVYLQRELVLNSDWTYTNKLGGNTSSSTSDYTSWEEESGTYKESGTEIMYTVGSDKRIDFNTKELVTYTKSNYSENINITGDEWTTMDTDLGVTYIIKKQ